MKEADTRYEITGAEVEKAVVAYFEGVDLRKQGQYIRGKKEITVVTTDRGRCLSATAKVGGIEMAVIRRYYDSGATYLRIMGDEIEGQRDEAICNRGIYGTSSLLLSRVPGNDLRNRTTEWNEGRRQDIAKRLGIGLTVSAPQEV